jgi:hypothetical protein
MADNVNVLNPEGELVSLPKDQAPDAIQSGGYSIATPQDTAKYAQEQKFGTPSQELLTGIEGAGAASTFGLSTGAEQALGASPENIRGREETNPISHAVGEGVGLFGSSFIPGGEGALLTSAGKSAAEVLGLGAEGASALSRIGAHTMKDATEMALFQSGDEVSKMLDQDPQQSVQTAVAHIGLAGLLGGVGGAVLGSVKPAAEATMGTKLGKLTSDFKSRLLEHYNNPEPVEQLTNELDNYYQGTRKAVSDTFGPVGLKAQEIQKLVPELNDKILDQTNNINDLLTKKLGELSDDPYVGKLQKGVEKYQSAITQPGVTSGEVFDATQELKQQLQEYGKFNKNLVPLAERDFREASKSLAYELRTSLEDSSVWGKAAERQQAINKAASEHFPALKDFEKRFTTEVNGEKTVDPGKVNTYLNQLGKPSAEIKQEQLKNYLDSADKFRSTLAQTHANLGLENPIKPTSTNMALASLGKKSQGAKFADAFTSYNIGHLAGAAVGGALGHGGLGALVGERALGPLFTSVLPSIAKMVLKSPESGVGLKAATAYGLAVAKGERAATKAVRNVFTSEAFPISEPDTEKLSKTIEKLNDDPSALYKLGEHSGAYLPQHNGPMAATAAAAIAYLNSIKPANPKLAPLDGEKPLNSVQEAKYESALKIAQQPLYTLKKVKNGTLTNDDMKHFVTLYPQLHQQLVQKFGQELSKGKQIPYDLRITMSKFMGTSLDSTLTTAGLQGLNPPTPMPMQKSPQGGPPSASSVKNLSKLGASAQTPSQARAARLNGQH